MGSDNITILPECSLEVIIKKLAQAESHRIMINNYEWLTNGDLVNKRRC